VDPEYRNALTMHCAEFSLSFDIAELGILDKISNLMHSLFDFGSFPRDSRYRLNVYEKGGFSC
jgi:hypothetical protein